MSEKLPNPEGGHEDIKALHADLGQEIITGNMTEALTIVNQIKDTLEKKLTSIQRETSGEREAEIKALIHEMITLKQAELTIFGTWQGLEVPLAVIVGEDAQFKRLSRDFVDYERGVDKDRFQEGLKTYSKGNRKYIELLYTNRDNAKRLGFKGIEFVLPEDDHEFIEKLRNYSKEILVEALTRIWKNLGAQNIPEEKRSFFVPE